MNQYTGQCPVCNQKLAGADDVVICPDCGAPYHRDCYKKEGQCVYSHLHADGFEYKSPQQIKAERAEKQMEEERRASGGGISCPRCGTANDSRNIFCENCGAPLHAPAQTPQQQPGAAPGGVWPPPAAYGPAAGGYGAYAQPNYAGEIDGIPKKDWAAFIGKSAPVYLQRMAAAPQRGGVSFMFSAFFLGPFYFIYRKMWGWAALSFVLFAATRLLVTLGSVLELGLPVVSAGGADALITAANIAYIASFVVQILSGLFALRLYRAGAAKKIRAVKEQYPDEAACRDALARKGGVSTLGAVLLGVVAFIAVTALGYWLYQAFGDALMSAVYALYGVAV